MALNREQVLFGCTLVVLGALSWRTFFVDAAAGKDKRAAARELEATKDIDASVALAAPRASNAARDILAPPSDTRPLPPLELEMPPVDALPGLLPPPLPGPDEGLLGKFLRAKPARFDAPGLFAGQTSSDDEAEAAPAPVVGKKKPVEPAVPTGGDLAERVAAAKQMYDWVRTNEFRFGVIANKNRWTLRARPDEDLLFVEYDVEAGRPRFPGMQPVPVPRKNIGEYGFADTVVNRIEARRSEFGDPLPAGQYDDALRFAEDCLELRHETPRALEVAAEMFGRAEAILAQDPAPKLGRARVLEAGFRFEEAHALYVELLQPGRMERSPLVLASLGQLEARFLLHDEAEAHLQDAVRYGATQWFARSALGRFLLARGRAAESVEHLAAAVQYEPGEPERKRVRAALRADHADGLLAIGRIDAALQAYEQALAADADSGRAAAGVVAATILGGKAPSATTDLGEGFEERLVAGLAGLRAGASGAEGARDALLAAASVDPLRAHAAWRALSWLAECAGDTDEALRFVDLALEASPSDFWSNYQRGRLCAVKDDLDGALESFRAALEVEVESTDTLAQLGALCLRRGEREEAARYLERATQLEPSWPVAWTLRGLAQLESGALAEAEESFKRVLSLDSDDPASRNGMAWCQYRRGDAVEAMARLRELDDNRRALPEGDPHRAWARGQIERIADHLEKQVWNDSFERRQLMNGWETQESSGPLVSIHDGVVGIAGQFKQDGRSRLWQRRSANDFVSIEARITVREGTNARVGMFVARESSRQGEPQVEAEVVVARHNEPGKDTVQTRIVKQRGEDQLPYADATGFRWPIGKPVVVRIERVGDASSTKVNVLFDGVPVVVGRALPSLGRTNNELKLGVFVEGQTGRSAGVDIDDVDIVFRKR
ncbi:MAG: tetratricopeptide repeat protein [Planctomycetia bacterium]